MGKYAGDNRAKVVDTYALNANNCTTKTCDAVAAGGKEYFGLTLSSVTGQMVTPSPIISPAGLQSDLTKKAQYPHTGVVNVTDDVNDELKTGN